MIVSHLWVRQILICIKCDLNYLEIKNMAKLTKTAPHRYSFHRLEKPSIKSSKMYET